MGATKRGSAIAAVIAAAMAGLLFGFDTAVIAGVITPFSTAYSLSSGMQGWVVSAALIGTLVAALTAGIPGDRYGSRNILIVVAIAFVISGVGCALSSGVSSFLFFRFIGGLAIGGASVLAPVFIAEISPSASRGRLVGLFQISIVTGILAAYLSNAVIGFFWPDPEMWRWKMAMLIAPGVIFLLAIIRVPNSPRWLIARGKYCEGLAVAEKLGLDEIKDFAVEERPSQEERLSWSRHRKPIMLAILLASFNQLSGINAILYYLNDIFAAAGFSSVSADVQTVAIGVANLVATVFAMAIIDRYGRKLLLLIGSVGTAFALVGVAIVFSRTGIEYLLLPLLVLYIVFFAISQGAVIWVYLSEIFPTSVRARGQALGSATHWIWAAILAGTFKWVAETADQSLPFVFFSIMMVIQFAMVLRYFPETKGVALEDMERNLRASGQADRV